MRPDGCTPLCCANACEFAEHYLTEKGLRRRQLLAARAAAYSAAGRRDGERAGLGAIILPKCSYHKKNAKEVAMSEDNTKGIWAIRWENKDWDWLADVAKRAGMSRSEFVRNAALSAAATVERGGVPYYVPEDFTAHNTRINNFRSEGDQIANTGGVRDAADCSRSDGEAKGGSTKSAKPKGQRRLAARN